MMNKVLRETIALPLAALLLVTSLGCQGTASRAVNRGQRHASSTGASNHKSSDEKGPIDLAEQQGETQTALDSNEVPRPICNPEDVQKTLNEVGKQLAEVSGSNNVSFEFQSIYNPTPRAHHSDTGTIYVSCGMLKALHSKDELAAILAMEMAEFLVERQQSTGSPSPESPITIATRLVKDSGYDQQQIRAVVARFDQADPVSRL